MLVCALEATSMPLKPGTIRRLFTPCVSSRTCALFFFLIANAVFFFLVLGHIFCVCVLLFFFFTLPPTPAQDLHEFENDIQVDLELRAFRLCWHPWRVASRVPLVKITCHFWDETLSSFFPPKLFFSTCCSGIPGTLDVPSKPSYPAASLL